MARRLRTALLVLVFVIGCLGVVVAKGSQETAPAPAAQAPSSASSFTMGASFTVLPPR